MLVVGIVVAAAQRKGDKKVSVGASEEERMEGGITGEESQESKSDGPPSLPASHTESREEKIASALVKTTDYIAEKWTEVDERFAISGSTLKAIATMQEMDERNKISETVVTSIKSFDEKYQVSQTAGKAVSTTVNKVKEWDETCKLSENVTTAGSNLATCLVDFERHYDISARIAAAFVFSLNTLTGAIASYTRSLPEAASTDSDAAAEASESAEGTGPVFIDIPMASAPVDPALQSPDEHGSYQAPAVPV